MLAEDVERRAIRRKAIALIRRERRGLKPGTYTFPPGWLPAAIPNHEAAEAAFFMQRKEQ